MSPLDDFGFVAFASVAVGVGGLEVVGFVEPARVARTGHCSAASANIEHGEDLGDYVIDEGALEFHLRGAYPAAFVVAVVYVAEHLAAMVGVPASGCVRFVYLQVVRIDRWLDRRSSPALRKLRATPELGSMVFTALSDPTNHPGAAARAFRGLLRRRRWILGHVEKQQQMLARSVKTKGLSVRNPSRREIHHAVLGDRLPGFPGSDYRPAEWPSVATGVSELGVRRKAGVRVPQCVPR